MDGGERVLCALCSVLCALCSVLCALCSVLCAPSSVPSKRATTMGCGWVVELTLVLSKAPGWGLPNTTHTTLSHCRPSEAANMQLALWVAGSVVCRLLLALTLSWSFCHDAIGWDQNPTAYSRLQSEPSERKDEGRWRNDNCAESTP
jgi:hypothetical protein